MKDRVVYRLCIHCCTMLNIGRHLNGLDQRDLFRQSSDALFSPFQHESPQAKLGNTVWGVSTSVSSMRVGGPFYWLYWLQWEVWICVTKHHELHNFNQPRWPSMILIYHDTLNSIWSGTWPKIWVVNTHTQIILANLSKQWPNLPCLHQKSLSIWEPP